MSKYIYGNTLAPFETAKSSDVISEFQKVETASAAEELRINSAIKLPASETTDVRISDNAAQRANKVLGFDPNGNVEVQAGFGTNRGAHIEAANKVYYIRDMVRDTLGSIGTVNNVYTCNLTHTSTADGLSGDSTYWDLFIDLGAL